jgi:hypothetical protein
MTKTQFITELETNVLRVIDVSEELDVVKNAAGIRSYIARVLEEKGDTAQSRSVGFYTIDEGTVQENVFSRDSYSQKNVLRDAVVSYMETLRPTTFIAYSVYEMNEKQRYAKVRVITNTTFQEKNVIVYKIGSSPISHSELLVI